MPAPLILELPQRSLQRVESLSVNGVCHALDADADRLLLSVLRDDLDLTGTKYACGQAQCGACVVLVDGQPLPACVTSLGEVRGKTITTIEGIGDGDRLHPVQQAFIDARALQCGFCTPGMIIEAVALLQENPQPDEAAIIAAMDRHLCRCGIYADILRAIRAAAAQMQADSSRPTRRPKSRPTRGNA